MRKTMILLVILVCSICTFAQDTTQGSLFAFGSKGSELGACPLKSTKVQTDISGFIARVKVTQEFENTFSDPIEAVYTFPLSQNSAVDNMTMKIGERIVRGRIMKREEARQVYEAAKSEGKMAGLLDQERPNIFTQAVANIMPGDKVMIEISYVETLKYEDGSYEFVFPMTVGPRYSPGSVSFGEAEKVSPPTIADSRAGHDISIEVNLNAGVPLEELRSNTHEISSVKQNAHVAKVSLKSEKTIPNKDFVLRYDVTGKRMEDAVLVSRNQKGGFFSLILSPPERLSSEDITPKEIVFVLDTSGSMEGFPLEKAKESMKMALDGLYPRDTFNLITFAGDTHILFDQPVPATRANLDKAKEFLESREGEGGTEMMKAIKAALAPSDSQEHIRIVCFMTDGQIGDDMEVIAEVKKHPNARVFSFGIGDSVNRFLLDKIAKEGRGEAEYVMLEDEGSAAARRFHERIRNPYLTDISIEWAGMPVSGIYPQRIPDLFGAKPVIVFGRYSTAAKGKIKLKGKIGGQPLEREIAIDLPAAESSNDVLSALWARTKIDELMSQSWDFDDEQAIPKPAVKTQITKLGIDYGLMTQYTSFVAVEETIVNQARDGKKVRVPIYATAGTVFEEAGVGHGSGNGSGSGQAMNLPASVGGLTLTANNSSGTGSGSGTGTGSGSGGGSGGGGTVDAVVNVTASADVIDTTSSSIQTTASTRQVQLLPKGANFTSVLKMSPGVRTANLGGGFQVDGTSGSENTFIIDGAEVTNFRTGTLNAKTVSSGVLNGRAITVAKPEYPAAAKAVKAAGAVNVQVLIDEKGDVISAAAASGHPLLRKAAENAASASKFAPATVGGHPVKVSGLIVYNFTEADAPSILVDKMTVAPLSADQKRAILLTEKLHFWVYDLVNRLQSGSAILTANESKFVRGGKAEIQLILKARSTAAVGTLKALGFESTSEKGINVSGRIAIEKLGDLAELTEVVLILPKL